MSKMKNLIDYLKLKYRAPFGARRRIQVSQLPKISDIGPKFSNGISTDHLLSLILKQVLDVMNTEVCIIWLKDSEGYLVPKMSFGLHLDLIKFFRIKDAPRPDLRTPIKRLLADEGLGASLVTPLSVGEERIGFLMVLAKENRKFTDADLTMFKSLANQSSLAIADIGLYERSEKRLKEKMSEMSIIFSISRSMSSPIDLDMILRSILEKSRLLVRAKFCVLKLLDTSRRRLVLRSFTGNEKTRVAAIIGCMDSIYKEVIRSGVPCVISDIDAYFKNNTPSCLKKSGLHSALMIPLFSKKRRIGILSAYLPEVRIFEKEEIEVFEMVASLCAMAIDNASMLERVKKDYLNTIKTLAKIIDANDTYASGHSDKVMRYSLLICKRLKLAQRDTNFIKTASLLHDIGKIGIDLSIIRKPGALTDEDWAKIKAHPEIGARIIRQVGFLNAVVPIIRYHHAHFDGGGYPEQGRNGKKIPLGARVIAVADAFDAMTSNRPYRRAMDRREAITELRRCAGTQFDPEVVEAFAG